MAVLDEAEFIQEWQEERKMMKSTTKLKYKLSSYALAPAVRKKFIEQEKVMVDKDNEILELKQLRNTLEAYSYDMRDGLSSKFSSYVDPKTKESFLAQIDEVVEWLYADGENAPKNQYLEKIRVFRSIGEPIK